MRKLYLGLGYARRALGMAGIVLPGLSTTPFANLGCVAIHIVNRPSPRDERSRRS